jgi:hypothetical protein
MTEALLGLQGKQVGEYTYNYWYRDTNVTHTMREYYHEKKAVRTVVLEKETKKGDLFVRLPHSLWITKDGYPPLVTDGALKNPLGDLTLYFAALPTVQSDDHIKIFDDALTQELKGMGLDYGELSKDLKAGRLIKNFPITGFFYKKDGVLNRSLLDEFEEKALKAYERVLQSKPKKCPVELFVKEILGPRTVDEYHFFKEEGFDVPLSAQRAFFTIMMDFRTPDG